MINRVFLVGNLGGDPEVRFTPGGTAVAKVSLATTFSRKDKEGKSVKDTSWHSVEVWGKQAETLGQYLSKGDLVGVEGRIRYDTWEKEGAKHYKTVIVADNVKFLKTKGKEKEASSEAGDGSAGEEPIPF